LLSIPLPLAGGFFFLIMTKTQHYKTTIKLALPVIIGQLGQIMVSVADSIMVGQLGTIQLAAAAFANSIFIVVLVFGMGLAYGLTPLVATAAGMNRTHIQGALLRQSFYLNILVALGLSGIMLGSMPLFQFLGQEPEVIEQAKNYYLILSATVLPIMLYLSFKQFAEGLADTRTAMVISIACNIVNVGLNYILIYGHWGIPDLGLEGAGIATFIARIIMLVAMAYYVLNAKKFDRYKLTLKFQKARKKVLRKLLSVGIPTGLQYLFEVSAFSVAAILAGMISAEALAAHQIAINIASVTYMAASGLGAAATVRVGNQAGAGDYTNLKLASGSIFRLSVGWMAFAGLIIFLFKHELAGFYSDDPVVLALAVKMLIVTVFFQLSDGVQVVALGALRGFTDVKIPTVITFVAYWIIALPAAYILSQIMDYGALGIWYALAGGLTISAILLVVRFNGELKKFAQKL